MQNNVFEIPERFKTPIAWSPTGKPVYLIAGGDGSTPPPTDPPAPINSTGEATPPINPEAVFTKADIEAAMEKARKQEKDKQYNNLESLKTQLNEWQTKENARQQADEAARAKAAADAKAAEEADMSAKDLLERWKAEQAERESALTKGWEDKFNALNTERENERVLLEKERAFAELQAYTQKRISEETNNIAPELLDFVNGNTQAEIDQSIELVKAKSAAMVQAAMAQMQAQMRTPGTRVSGLPSIDPNAEYGDQKFSAQDIANMSMADYAKNRGRFGMGRVSNNTGLFG